MIQFRLTRFFTLICQSLAGNWSYFLIHNFNLSRSLIMDSLLLLLSCSLHTSVIKCVNSGICSTSYASCTCRDSLTLGQIDIILLLLIFNLHIRLELLLFIKNIYVLIQVLGVLIIWNLPLIFKKTIFISLRSKLLVNVLQIFGNVTSDVCTVVTFAHLVFFLVIVILKRKRIIGSRLNFLVHTFIEIITNRISYRSFLLKCALVLIRNTQSTKIALIDHNLSTIILLYSVVVALSLFLWVVQAWTFVFATELPRHLDKLRAWISHLPDFLIILMWLINLILRNQHIILMLWIETPHIFTMSNNSAVGIGDDHLLWISTGLNGLRNVLANVVTTWIAVNGVKAWIVGLRRLSVIKRITLQMMCAWRCFVHVRNLILIFFIIWTLNRLWNTIYQLILLK